MYILFEIEYQVDIIKQFRKSTSANQKYLLATTILKIKLIVSSKY